MSLANRKRLSRLEAARPAHNESRNAPWHTVMVKEGGDEDAAVQALVATGTAKPTDNFILLVPVPAPAYMTGGCP